MATSTPIASAALNGTAVRHPAGTAVPPGPRMPALLQTLLWGVAPTWVMDRYVRKLGECFTLTFWPSGLKFVLVSGPEAIKTVFTAPPEAAPSAAGSSPIAAVMGRSSVIVLTGAEHMRQRKLLLPPFHGERMREYEDVIVRATRTDMAGWELGSPMGLHERTRQITLEVILRAVFGVEAERMGPLRAAIGVLLERPRTLTVLRVLLRKPNGQRPPGAVGRAIERLDRVIYAEIAHRRAQSDLEQRTDILSLLMLAQDEDGQAMSDEELRDELVTLLLAGHETTATAVAWAIERLLRHPQKLARLVAEIDAGESDRYLMAVVNETLRVRPVVPIVVRMLQQDMEIGGYNMPAGTRVAPSIYLTNRSPRAYEAPLEFRPERFLESSPETFSWIPFGGGIRRCIGASFAQLEMKLMLRTMLAELHPSVPTDSRVGSWRWRNGEWIHRRAITLVPAAGARVVWQRRAPAIK